jgi:hypothetical protein
MADAGGAEDKVHEGIVHLQAAAREVIQATRSLLDAAEELIDDPRSVQELASSLGSLAAAAAARLRPSSPAEAEDDDGHVERIKVH